MMRDRTLTPFRRRLAFAVASMLACGGAAAQGSDAGDLRRDQEQIIRKSERLRDLIQRLIERYRDEKRDEQVRLLEEGLRHLDDVQLLEDVAGIRDSLRGQALTEALRQQGEVVDELERLLAILRDRRSVENLDREIEAAARLAATAGELYQRQTDLQRQTRDQASAEPNPAERALLDRLADLARQQRAESQRNSRDAGIRAPFLEEARRRIEALLDRQGALEKRSRAELSGDDPEAEAARRSAFELGELEQRQRELGEARARERAARRTAEAAEELTQALTSGDQDAVRQAMETLQTRLDGSARRSTAEAAPAVEDLKQALSHATPDQREALADLAERARQLPSADPTASAEANESARKSLEAATRQAADQQADGAPPKPGSSAEALQKAADAMKQAGALDEAGMQQEASAQLAEAARQLAEARSRQRRERPDASRTAQSMAAEAAQVAQELRRTPTTPAGESGEQAAATDLERAESALRDAGRELAQEGEQRDTAVGRALDDSRRALESARDRLDEQLQAETAGRGEELAASAQRQQEIRQQTEQAGRQASQAARDGQVTPEQSAAAEQSVQRAQDLMQKAVESLQSGQQSSAASQQRDAAEALEQAARDVERHRPLGEQQRQALRDLAKQQEQLQDDIIRLAKLVEDRKNHDAQQALDEAAQAAQRAKQAMDDGDAAEADAQQEQARDKLDQARDELDAERDRYQDLREEEMLFRIRDELTNFLERQRPITAGTAQAAQELGDRTGMTRRLRRELNDLAQQEKDLSGKAEYLRSSLEEEGTLVFSHALRSNEEDLQDISTRLGGRNPDPGELTAMLQHDVEARTQKLLDALEREQERRRQERQQRQGGQNQQNSNDGNNQTQRPRLVPIVAELEMLKRMEQDLQERAERLGDLLSARGDGVTELETGLVERLAHRHNAITKIFLQLKAQLEQALQPADGAATGGDQGTETKKEPGK